MPSRADQAVPPPAPRSFDEVFFELNLTPEERSALVWHLAAIRMRKLVEELLPEPAFNKEELLKVLRTDGEIGDEK